MTSNAHLETGLVIKNFIKNTAYSISYLDKGHRLHVSSAYVAIEFLIDAPKITHHHQPVLSSPISACTLTVPTVSVSLQKIAIKYAAWRRAIPLILCSGLKMPSAY